jgi:hypothetical protein
MAGEPNDPRNTREFVVLWNETVEEHLTRQLTQLLPGLLGDDRPTDSARDAAVARHLVHALRLAALSGDAAAGLRYLSGTARVGDVGGADSGGLP